MVDSPYFIEILKRSQGVTWHISYQYDSEKEERVEKLHNMLAVQGDTLDVELFTLDDMRM